LKAHAGAAFPVWAFSMSDTNSTAIQQNITSPNVVSADGVSVTNNRIPDQIAGAKYLASQNALAAIAAGGVSPFVGVRFCPPGARGDQIDGDC